MQLCGAAVVLLMTLSTACGLKCYSCVSTDPRSCTSTTSCSILFDRCFSLKIDGFLTSKGCQNKVLCVSPMTCCEGDLCNSAKITGPSLILLLASATMIALFL